MSTNFTRLIGLLLLLGIFAVAVLLLMPNAAPAPNVETVTPIPNAPGQAYPPPGGSTPLPTIAYAYPPPDSTASAAMRVPLCQFQGGETAPEVNDVALEDYVFSAPSVVLTSTTPLGIADWLPDNQRLLITRDLPQSSLQNIETYNLLTGEIQVIVEPHYGGKPIWLSDVEAVAYYVYRQSGNYPIGDYQELWISYGNPKTIEQVSADMFGVSLATDGKKSLYFLQSVGDIPLVWDASTKISQVMALDPKNLFYSKISNDDFSVPNTNKIFEISPQPNGNRIALFQRNLLFLANTQNEELCEVELGGSNNELRSASNLQWSTDGRYLAMVITTGYPGTIPTYRGIMVLDTQSGNQSLLKLDTRFVYEIDWSPNQHILAAFGEVGTEMGHTQMGIFLIDVETQQSKRMLPDLTLESGLRWALAWSPDGQTITLDCTTGTPIVEFRACITHVNTQP